MILTEAEAKTRWCPMTRVLQFAPKPNDRNFFVGVAAVNRDDEHGDAHHNAFCLASGCMLWQWSNDGRHVIDAVAGVPTHGFCGLIKQG